MTNIIKQILPNAGWSDEEYNYDWVFADNLLAYLLKPNPHKDAERIAKIMGVPLIRVKEGLLQIGRAQPCLIAVESSRMGYERIVNCNRAGIHYFLRECGGFTALLDERNPGLNGQMIRQAGQSIMQGMTACMKTSEGHHSGNHSSFAGIGNAIESVSRQTGQTKLAHSRTWILASALIVIVSVLAVLAHTSGMF
jgi:hypothetical protein